MSSKTTLCLFVVDADDGGAVLVDVVGQMGVCCSIFLLDACLE